MRAFGHSWHAWPRWGRGRVLVKEVEDSASGQQERPSTYNAGTMRRPWLTVGNGRERRWVREANGQNAQHVWAEAGSTLQWTCVIRWWQGLTRRSATEGSCGCSALASHAKRGCHLQGSPQRNPSWHQQQAAQQRRPDPLPCHRCRPGQCAFCTAARRAGAGAAVRRGGRRGGAAGAAVVQTSALRCVHANCGARPGPTHALPLRPLPPLPSLSLLLLLLPWPLSRLAGHLPWQPVFGRACRPLVWLLLVLHVLVPLPVRDKRGLHCHRQRKPHHHHHPSVCKPAAVLGRRAGQLCGATGRHRLGSKPCPSYKAGALAPSLLKCSVQGRQAPCTCQGGAQGQQLRPDVVPQRQRQQQRQQRESEGLCSRVGQQVQGYCRTA